VTAIPRRPRRRTLQLRQHALAEDIDEVLLVLAGDGGRLISSKLISKSLRSQ